MTEIPPKTIESPLDPIADLGTLEARGTADSTTPKASETMDPALCHKSSFNPFCNVHGFFFLKTS